MTIVMQMSTDQDIVSTTLDSSWSPVAQRYSWDQVKAANLKIAEGATIVVVAHGDGKEIGNAKPGTVDVSPETFLALIQGNMAANSLPAVVYISTCAPGIAEFAARVRIGAESNKIWSHTRVYGHHDPVGGPVPPRKDVRWTQIF